MKFLFDAIVQKYNDSELEYPLYPADRVRQKKRPYITYILVDIGPYYTFSGNGEEAIVQFSIWSDDQEEATLMFNELTHVFDDAELEYTDGYTEDGCKRVGGNIVPEDEETWHVIAEYHIKMRGLRTP